MAHRNIVARRRLPSDGTEQFTPRSTRSVEFDVVAHRQRLREAGRPHPIASRPTSGSHTSPTGSANHPAAPNDPTTNSELCSAMSVQHRTPRRTLLEETGEDRGFGPLDYGFVPADFRDVNEFVDIDGSPLQRRRFSNLSADVRSLRSSRSRVRAPYERRFVSAKHLLLDFCSRTSSHGIPHIGDSYTCVGKTFWTIVFMVCFSAFVFQTYWTMSEFFQFRTIIEMQLKFDAAPFPAATVCNLNPFKNGKLQAFEKIGQTFQLWEQAMNKGKSSDSSNRPKRQVLYQPILVRCTCAMTDKQCVPQRNPLQLNTSVCMCFEDVNSGDIWPCYPSTAWSETKCAKCSISNSCPLPGKDNTTADQRTTPCLCQSVSNHCLIRPTGDIRWWSPHDYTVHTAAPKPSTTTPSPEAEEALGLNDLSDKGAITTKTKENIIFIVAALPKGVRRDLSYTLNEFVLQCSFNSEDCDMNRDFRLHMDPEYGNCYTFNYNDSVTLTNSRAGPMYGLRLLLNVNQSDYMPTTEAAGVRLVVHEQDDEPFPDTFGYSAPTGFVSSFGLKTKVLHRLGWPYGKCVEAFRPIDYIYEEHYSPEGESGSGSQRMPAAPIKAISLEGCFRNCFQHIVVRGCGCGDPRFPLPPGKRACDAVDPVERRCLTNITDALGGFHHMQQDCDCVQPCQENVFETAYSAAAWPALNFKISEDCPAQGDIMNDSTACTEYYRQNTAYIEVYYEQLNFEYLRETAGYTVVNLFSDFGGNIGLWIGFSAITVVELIELFMEACYFCYYKQQRRKSTRRRKQRQQYEMPDMPLANRLEQHPRGASEKMTSSTMNVHPSSTVESELYKDQLYTDDHTYTNYD